uniref:Macaca fascicularis brain cDNA clone: QflA-18244, similar to human KIAA1600 protein (KIAA1600), mRNA, RefSeq: XM_049351.4 n=1 Tax=Macaca fascicularis TaxID=9541 RepID=I7GMT3_MACFA|nr:unnamed protein product [Macaca fascicularis]
MGIHVGTCSSAKLRWAQHACTRWTKSCLLVRFLFFL